MLYSRLQVLAWQIDVLAHERTEYLERCEDTPGHVAKWEGGGPQNRYERVRFSPWPQIIARLRSSLMRFNVGRRDIPRS